MSGSDTEPILCVLKSKIFNAPYIVQRNIKH